jgi:hypothetical protein
MPPKGKRNRDVVRFKGLMTANRFIGLLKSRPISDAVDCSTMLTAEPSFPMHWTQLGALLQLLIRISTGDTITKTDAENLHHQIEILNITWSYMRMKSPRKGIIENALSTPEGPESTGNGGHHDGPPIDYQI